MLLESGGQAIPIHDIWQGFPTCFLSVFPNQSHRAQLTPLDLLPLDKIGLIRVRRNVLRAHLFHLAKFLRRLCAYGSILDQLSL
jgi:hypothetical protein